jgi:tetratricopeptide (TPR) repeat protein
VYKHAEHNVSGFRVCTGMTRGLLLAVFGMFLIAQPTFGADSEDYAILRDTLKPGSPEAYKGTYKTRAWQPKERIWVQENFRRFHALAPALLPRGAADGTLSVYRANLRTYAKGSMQRIIIDDKVFLYPDYSARVLLHELVHSADSYGRLSGSDGFRKVFEPKIKKARALLQTKGLTPATAAALPIGAARKEIERAIRTQTGLPSAYAAQNLSECLSEVVSFWVMPEYKYTPDPQSVGVLQTFISEPSAPNLADINFRKAEALQRGGKIREAIKALDKTIKTDPNFYQAYSMRGYLYLALKKPRPGLADLKRARDTIPRMQRNYAFYDGEWRRVQKQLGESQ